MSNYVPHKKVLWETLLHFLMICVLNFLIILQAITWGSSPDVTATTTHVHHDDGMEWNGDIIVFFVETFNIFGQHILL